ncbi:MAG: hypothetical protein AVDCRST_MAG13-224, partial [uncultured Solirubrobacteraceae bacterium]
AEKADGVVQVAAVARRAAAPAPSVQSQEELGLRVVTV